MSENTTDFVLQQVKGALAKGLKPGSREYEVEITELVIKKLKNTLDIQNVQRELEKKITTLYSVNKVEAFTVFFVLFTYYRRIKNYKDARRLVNKFEEAFRDNPFFVHLKVMAYKMSGDNYDLLEALRLIYQLVESDVSDPEIKRNPGVLHNFAETIVEALERQISIEEINNVINKDLSKEKLLKIAKEKMEIALKYHPNYAKFYITLGRIYMLLEDYESAIKAIREGISLEDPSEKDYPIRISEYNLYLLSAKTSLNLKWQVQSVKAEMMNHLSNLASEIETQKLELQKMITTERGRNIEILSIFTALIGILLTSIMFSVSSKSGMEASGIMLVLSGTLMIFVLSTSVVIGNINTKNKGGYLRYLFGYTIATIMMLLGIILVSKSSG